MKLSRKLMELAEGEALIRAKLERERQSREEAAKALENADRVQAAH